MPDYIIRATVVDAEGNLRTFDQSHPDFKVVVSCLGMCGVVLDVTVKVSPGGEEEIEGDGGKGIEREEIVRRDSVSVLTRFAARHPSAQTCVPHQVI
jgi:hypothetical protein